MYIKYMFDYPFGRHAIGKLVNAYAHDIILDTYSMAGVFACGAVVAILINTIIKSIKILLNKKIKGKLKKLILNIIIAMFVAFATEPILIGDPWLFASFCVMYGSITRLTESDFPDDSRSLRRSAYSCQ